MEERRDYIALDWVTNEIQETLLQALQAMDSYVQNPEDITKLRFGLSYVHQVLGSLRMVEFSGAALLAEELEYVLQALVQQKISAQNTDDAIFALQNGMRQLPIYLQRIKNLRGELPAALLPTINDLRAVRGQHLASESQLFNPQLPSVDGVRINLAADELAEMAGKLRQMFQIALMGFLRGSDAQKNLNYLAKVFARMVKLCDGRPQQMLWKTCIALTEGLLNQTIAASPAVKQLLRQIDAMIRRFVEQGDAALDVPAPDSLLRNILFYIAASKASSRFISDVREQCQLDSALLGATNLSDENISQPDAQALNSVVENVSLSLRELAAHQASRAGDANALRDLLVNYRAILDTLAVLGMSAPLRGVQAEYAQLSRQLAGNAINADMLANGAEKLAQIADSFGVVEEKTAPTLFNDSEEAQGHLDRAYAAVISETRIGLEQAKEAVIEFVARQWQRECLENIPTRLKEIAGSLRMADMAQAAAVVDSCECFVRQDLLSSKDVPEWQLLDTLADAIASIDYYLELVAEDNEFDTSHVLSIAEGSAARLGYPVGVVAHGVVDAPVVVNVHETEQEENAQPAEALRDDLESIMPEPVIEEGVEENIEERLSETIEEAPASNVIEVSFGSSATIAAENAIETTDIAETDFAIDTLVDDAIENQSASEVAVSEIPASEPAQAEVVDDEEFDPEIVEIFIEEAGEVLDTINEYFEQWLADPNNSETMPIMRRAFHTLKGSGRMVGATDIGEMAWSIENMLNRVIEGTVVMDQQRLDVVTEAKNIAPTMVAAFSERRRCDMAPVNLLMEKALALAKEQNPAITAAAENLAVESAHVETVEAMERDVAIAMDAEDSSADESAEFQFAETETENSIESAWQNDAMAIANTLDGDTAQPESVDESASIDEGERELLEIFMAEALGHLEQLNNFIADVRDHAVCDISEELQRALHTLKGSANMANVLPLVAIVSPVETMVRESRAAQLMVDNAVFDLLVRAAELIQIGIEQLLTQPHAAIVGSEKFIADVEFLHQQRIDAVQDAHDNGTAQEGMPPDVLNRFLLDVMDQLVIVGDELTLWRMRELSAERIAVLPATVSQIVDLAAAVNMAPIEQLAQGLYQCLQTAAHAVVHPPINFFALATVTVDSLIDMLDRIAGQQAPVLDQSLFKQLIDFTAPDAIATHDDAVIEDNSAAQFIEQFVTLNDVQIEADNALEDDAPIDFSTEFVDVATDAVADAEAVIDAARGGEILAEFAEVVAEKLTAAESIDTQELVAEFDSTEDSNLVLNDELAEQSADELTQTSEVDTWFASADIHDAIAVNSDAETEIAFDESMDDAAVDFAEFDDEPLLIEERLIDEASHEEIALDAQDAVEMVEPIAETHEPVAELPIVEDEETADEIDPDILEIFLEEAADILDGLDETINRWNDDADDSSIQEEMQRLLHTLKGGARVSGLRQLGNLTHNFETFLIHSQQQNLPVDGGFLAQVQSYQDQLVQRVEALRRGEKEVPLAQSTTAAIAQETITPTASQQGPLEMTAEQAAHDLAVAAEELQQQSLVDDVTISDIVHPPSKKSDNVLPFNRLRTGSEQRQDVVPFIATRITKAAPRRVEQSAMLDDAAPQSLRKAPQEAVKISAQLLEQLVNLAGETSISRGRVEAQVSEVLFSLDDMQATVNRLHDQLRRLDQETEAQIVFRQEQLETEGMEDFDPLEFDRYSLLQQLARSLLESASDLVDIRGTLVDKSKDMETLLVQQSRINTDLQEGLMRSRMVPFSRMVPRLRRIIRQVATELDKDVEMIVDNAEGELDRTMLERINAPLEHMLRNAVDHGIESADVRVRNGKPAQGTVRLSLLREGADVVLVLEDDGGGIDVAAVRAKAIERGLLLAGAAISDHEALQFIMQPGFSTAKHVTQISGRGVGMDVVASEIKQLGGNLDIQSVKGQGTRFVVRLPFTVSINRALMVTVAGDSYAIPLNTIEGIVRVSPFELEAYYQPDAPPFEYAGQPYSVRYLGSLLHTQDQPMLEGLSLPLPVILVRAGEYAVAVQVDSLQGSREVVVKSLGAQFAMVQGLSGATVLGDGSVVVILDLMAMLRAEILQASRALLDAAAEEQARLAERPLLVMVVDDSVTVRKVTTRFLERQGMEVVTAKDGADAVAHLLETDRLPDVMLLDIEMPRMDGFEVANRVRHNNRLKDIPIIMITSRTGDKHRERAMSLGVNRYLGKPFQESVVLENISELTGRDS